MDNTFFERWFCVFFVRIPLSVVSAGCSDLDTLSLLLGTRPLIDRIAMYGNANVGDLSQWVELLGLDEDSIPDSVGVSWWISVLGLG